MHLHDLRRGVAGQGGGLGVSHNAVEGRQAITEADHAHDVGCERGTERTLQRCVHGVVVDAAALHHDVRGCVQRARCHHLPLCCVQRGTDVRVVFSDALVCELAASEVVGERVKHHWVHLHRSSDALVQLARHSEALCPLVLGGLAHLHHDDTVAQVRLHVVTQALLAQIGTAEHDAASREHVVTQPALKDHRCQRVLDELPGLGDLVQADDGRG